MATGSLWKSKCKVLEQTAVWFYFVHWLLYGRMDEKEAGSA